MKELYTLDDLTSRDTLDEGANQPARLAVIGCPVAHSLSPQLHQDALNESESGARYIRLEVPPGRVTEALERLADLQFVGANVTVPHKFEALAAADEIDDSATMLGAANTILFDGDRRLAFNTDGPGFVRAIHEEFLVDVKDLRIMVVGSGGGAGRAIAAQCVREGCEKLVLVNRTVEKAEALARELAPYLESQRLEGPGDRLKVFPLGSPEVITEADHIDLIVNTTSVGLKRSDSSPLPSPCLQPHHLVYDTIYNPPQTRLLHEAERIGARAANGCSLLLHQGVLSFELWFPGKQPLATMRRSLRNTLNHQ
ncbi:MAG: shikimate dehydrogenase [Roseibacillus sp.]|nr:shikimate dehydrogenase [Roseibacillus sp.]HCQ38944.1 shikimate dehydrogenase [Verrucomicrobiales bacterium]